MQRISVFVGTWASVLAIAGVCLAADPRRPNNNQPAAASPQPAPSGGAGGGLRYVAPAHNSGNFNNPNRVSSEARRAAQAAAAAQRAAAAAQAASNAAASARNAANAAAQAQQNANNQRPYGYGYPPYGYSPYGSPYGYSPYGYSPYGYPYSPYGYMPPGTTPYVLGYNPLTGATYLYPYSGGYSSYYPSYGNQYPYYRNPYLGYGYPSAVFAPAGQLYGPGPIQQLMGVGQWFQPQANANAANGNGFAANGNGNAANANPGLANNNDARPGAALHDADAPAHKPAVAGGKAMEIAWKFITYGDAHFGNQKYDDALDRYRHAARECPTLSDAWFRQGFALAALGRYEQAAKAMRHGLEEKPDWVDNHFRLAELYGDDADDKKAMLDKMVKASDAQAANGDLAFVVGVHLYCDDKPDQAAPFFHRAAQVSGTDADVKPFLARGQ